MQQHFNFIVNVSCYASLVMRDQSTPANALCSKSKVKCFQRIILHGLMTISLFKTNAEALCFEPSCFDVTHRLWHHVPFKGTRNDGQDEQHIWGKWWKSSNTRKFLNLRTSLWQNRNCCGFILRLEKRPGFYQ